MSIQCKYITSDKLSPEKINFINYQCDDMSINKSSDKTYSQNNECHKDHPCFGYIEVYYLKNPMLYVTTPPMKCLFGVQKHGTNNFQMNLQFTDLEENPYMEDFLQDGGKYTIDVFDIDIGRCMFCGLCGEACPYDALHMGSGFEEGVYDRQELIVDVEKLKKSSKHPSAWFRPQLNEDDYNPQKGQPLEWNQVGRHEKPSSKDQQGKWADR